MLQLALSHIVGLAILKKRGHIIWMTGGKIHYKLFFRLTITCFSVLVAHHAIIYAFEVLLYFLIFSLFFLLCFSLLLLLLLVFKIDFPIEANLVYTPYLILFWVVYLNMISLKYWCKHQCVMEVVWFTLLFVVHIGT